MERESELEATQIATAGLKTQDRLPAGQYSGRRTAFFIQISDDLVNIQQAGIGQAA